MPLSGPSSYVPTVEQFIAHWDLVNTDQGSGNPMTIRIGPPANPETIAVANLVTLHGNLIGAQNLVQSALNAVELSGGDVKLGKATLLPLAQAYGRKVRALFPPGSPHLGMTPEMPKEGSGQETFLRPMRDVRDAWQKIEDDGTIILLPPADTGIGGFDTALENLSTQWQALNTNEVKYGYELDERNAHQARADDILGRYRGTVESLYTPEDPLVLSIPRLHPLPGHTPDAVFLTAVWDSTENKARLSWPASADPDLASYQIRMSPSATYVPEAESIAATIPAGGALEYLTDEGLPAPGSTASYKVYVVLTTDNERGSNPVAVTRP